MITLPDYASFDSVRAALGVSNKEIPDTALDLDIYALFVQEELDEISDTLRTEFEAIVPPGADADEIAKYDAVRVFSSYAIAYKVTDSLPNASPKTITEGKASLSRHSDSPYKLVIIEVRKSYIYWKKILEGLIDDTEPTAVVQTLMSVSNPDYDPVIGS